ncbi:hypothetical protein [Rhodococcus triatomae]|nr:hypothetical protein G419_25287 [Rhodococcus triatomae BKS 15-14]
MSEDVTVSQTEAEATTETTDTVTPEKNWQAEADKWKALARKHEDQSKANADKARQFDEITEAQKTELERALEAAAQATARAEASELRQLRAEVAAETGVPLNLINGTTAEEMAASAAAVLEFRDSQKHTPADFGGGKRGEDVGSKVTQLTREDMARMSPEERVKAHAEGRFDQLLGN